MRPLLLALMLALVQASRGQAVATAPALDQGVTGQVVRLRGNFMPGPAGPSGQVLTAAVPVHIFRGPVAVFQQPNTNHPAFVQRVMTGADGRFQCALPPGEYTVVAELDGALYLNWYGSGGPRSTWATVPVRPQQWTPILIRDTRRAPQ